MINARVFFCPRPTTSMWASFFAGRPCHQLSCARSLLSSARQCGSESLFERGRTWYFDVGPGGDSAMAEGGSSVNQATPAEPSSVPSLRREARLDVCICMCCLFKSRQHPPPRKKNASMAPTRRKRLHHDDPWATCELLLCVPSAFAGPPSSVTDGLGISRRCSLRPKGLDG